MVTTTTAPTFNDLAALEPGLMALLETARRVSSRGQPDFCANRIWYHDLKPRLVNLVGWTARKPDPRLHTEHAYDVAYETVYGALPNCRHPGPFC